MSRRRFLWTTAELLVTAGALLLLLVIHQLWWTNWDARRDSERQVRALERGWGQQGGGQRELGAGDVGAGNSASGHVSSGDDTTVPAASDAVPRSRAYAVLVVPRLSLRVPVAEGVGKRDVLDKGWAGHYPGTQQPGQIGNFALAGHRNTHGEPFRRLDRLRPKDTVRVETADAVYTYAVGQILPQTSAHDSGVLRAVPRSFLHPGYGYSAPAAYLTLTTCTPEFTSRYRLVVWGELVAVRGR